MKKLNCWEMWKCPDEVRSNCFAYRWNSGDNPLLFKINAKCPGLRPGGKISKFKSQ